MHLALTLEFQWNVTITLPPWCIIDWSGSGTWRHWLSANIHAKGVAACTQRVCAARDGDLGDLRRDGKMIGVESSDFIFGRL